MTIQLPHNLEQSVQALVSGGRFASVDDAMAEAARLLLNQDTPTEAMSSGPAITLDQFHRQLLAEGVLSRLPDPSLDAEDDDEPLIFEGEPVSETIIRERR